MSKNKILQIGITGGIGSGKSLVSRVFATLGIPVYDADTRAKWIMNYHEGLKGELKALFGEETYTTEGQLNRAYLAQKVFNDSRQLELLNQLVHPKVGQDFLTWTDAHARAPYVLKEAALLFESGSYQQLDKTITVFAPVDVRIKRVLQRDPQRSPVQVQAIIDQQLPEEARQQRADFVLYNDESQLVIPQVLALHKKFLALADN